MERFKCGVSSCPKGYQNKSSLNRHKKGKHSEQPFKSKCDVCEKELESGSMKRHEEIHKNRQKTSCSKCGKEIFDISAHSANCKGGYECDHCKVTLYRKKDLVRHVSVHTNVARVTFDGLREENDGTKSFVHTDASKVSKFSEVCPEEKNVHVNAAFSSEELVAIPLPDGSAPPEAYSEIAIKRLTAELKKEDPYAIPTEIVECLVCGTRMTRAIMLQHKTECS